MTINMLPIFWPASSNSVCTVLNNEPNTDVLKQPYDKVISLLLYMLPVHGHTLNNGWYSAKYFVSTI